MADLMVSPEAEQDLVDIWCYIAEDSPSNADNYIDKLYSKAVMLAETPHLGIRRDELTPGLRCFPVDRYIFYYRPMENGAEIVRVLHGSRDAVTILTR